MQYDKLIIKENQKENVIVTMELVFILFLLFLLNI